VTGLDPATRQGRIEAAIAQTLAPFLKK